MKLSTASRDADHLRSLKLWFRELHEDADGSVSLQHELLDAILTLRYTRDKDGWCNWNESYHDYLDTLRTWLCRPGSLDRIAQDIATVQHAGDSGADDGEFADTELARLTSDVFLWCLERSDLILLPGGYHFWSDVPSDCIP